MKKIVIILLILFSLSLVGCKEKQKVVHLYIYDMDDPFMEDYADYILNYADGLFKVELFDAQNSQIIQNELIEEGLEDSPDLMIINPVDRLGAYTIIDKVKEHDIPIVFINREPLESDLEKYDLAYYVGAIASQSGIFQAEIVDELFGGNPNDLNEYDLNDDNVIQAVIFKGEQGHQDAELRTEFVQTKLTELGYDFEILTVQTADWSFDNAYQLAKPTLEVYGDQIELVISNNDWMALGVIKAMKELGFIEDSNNDGVIDNETEPWIPVIGIDGIQEGLDSLEAGYLFATVINDSEEQAKACVLLADSILKNITFDNPDFSLVNNKYVWVDYKKQY